MIKIEHVNETEISIKVTKSKLDVLGAFTFQEKLFKLLEAYGNKNLSIDFGNVVYCSSAVISALLQIERRLSDTNHEITLLNTSDFIRKIFWLADIEDLFEFKG